MAGVNMLGKYRFRSWFRAVSATAVIAGAVMNLASMGHSTRHDGAATAIHS